MALKISYSVETHCDRCKAQGSSLVVKALYEIRVLLEAKGWHVCQMSIPVESWKILCPSCMTASRSTGR